MSIALSVRFQLMLCFLALTVCSPLCLPAQRLAADESTRPNVVVILSDDQGWGDLSLHGNPNLSTPNIDSLAKQGAHVDNFYVCAVCSPTRAEFLTGRYHGRSGVYSTSAGGERFDAAEQTIAQVFQKAGYQTACYGKWHSGMQWPYHPNARGFQDYYGFCSGHWGNYYDPMLEHNGKIVQGEGFIIDDLTNHAIEFISNSGDKPFFVYLPLNTPHSPMQVPQAYWDRFKNKELVPDAAKANRKAQKTPHARAALAMCENIDDNVGRLMKHLEATGKDRETIVVYFSDNGPNGARFNGGMRGRKGSTNEGGLRSPCVIRYPDKIKPGTKVATVSAAIDLLPTLADFAGIDWKASQVKDRPVDGVSFANQLSGNDRSDEARERILFSNWNNKFTARTQRYRYHHTGTLYDIEAERGEMTDVADQHPEVAKKLDAALQQWKSSLSPIVNLPRNNIKPRPFPIAHPDALWTQLPARDATYTGTITRSNRFPNCSYLFNWSDTEAEIRWDVEALGSGRYEVQMYYACPEPDVGAKIELRYGDSKTTATIRKPVESPFIGAVNDRVPRSEGDVRSWQAMDLGELKITPGRQPLILKATKVPGKQVAELRLLMLKKIDAQ